ncbi:WXG100 family type VII secretion target [Kitasatospora gansuensis]
MARNPYFESKALIPLKGMLEVSKPERLKEVSEHWKNVEAELRSAADDLKKAVEHATQNWQGVAAQGFATRAGVIHTSMSNTAAHAVQTSSAMNYASQALSQSKSAMNGIDVPSSFESGMKWASDLGQRSDAQFKADVAGGMDRVSAVNKNYDELSATEIAHQYAIGVMEDLAPHYEEAAKYMQPPNENVEDPSKPYPPAPDKQWTQPPPKDRTGDIRNPQVPPGSGDSGDKPRQIDPNTPRHPGPDIPVHPGPTLPPGPGGPGHTLPPVTTLPHPGLDLDSVKPPVTGTPLPSTHNPLPGGPGIGGGHQPGGGPGLGLPGFGGGPGLGGGGGGRGGGLGGGSGRGSGGLSGSGAGGGAGGRAGGAGAGAGAGAAGGAAGQGRGGAPGMGGMPGGGAAGGKAGAGKPSLVRREGGTVGGAKAGGASGRAFTQGGSGLGQGGQGRGGAAGAGGMPGPAAAAGRRRTRATVPTTWSRTRTPGVPAAGPTRR